MLLYPKEIQKDLGCLINCSLNIAEIHSFQSHDKITCYNSPRWASPKWTVLIV